MIEHAVLVAYDGGTHTATVRVTGSQGGDVTGVPVSLAIDPGHMVPAAELAVARFGGGGPRDLMVLGVY